MTGTNHEVSNEFTGASKQGAAIREAAPPEERRLAVWEILSIISSTLIVEWVVFSMAGANTLLIVVPVALAFALIFVSHRLRGESARNLGWRLDNFLQALQLLSLPMLLITALCIVFGWTQGSLNFRRWVGGQSLFGLPALTLLWGLLQQYVLQGVINRRAQLIWGRGGTSVLAVALIFASLHLPNPALSVATFTGGVVWAAIYQRAPNLPALTLSHSFMTYILISTFPPSILGGLRVGFKYFN